MSDREQLAARLRKLADNLDRTYTPKKGGWATNQIADLRAAADIVERSAVDPQPAG